MAGGGPAALEQAGALGLLTGRKIVFDDLRNNATLAAMLAYRASEDPERMDVSQRVLPVDERTGQQGVWPRCWPPRRSSPGQ